MKIIKKFWPYLLIILVVLFFFNPIFKGQIPFPGDLLVNQTPYSSESLLGYVPGSYPNKAQGPDVIYEIYPWKHFSISQLKNGQIPFWNPYNFSGNPQLANFQTAIFYPLNLFFLILPFNLSWTIFIMLQPLLASVFMYLFLSKGLNLKRFASLIGGILFAFSSYMVVWIEYGNIAQTLLWLPLALLLTKKLMEKTNILNFLLLVIIFSLSFLAGYIQGFFYLYVVVFLYFFFLLFFEKKGKNKLKKSLVFLSSLIFPIFLCSFQLLPTLELFTSSTRGNYSLSQITKSLQPFYYWITIIFPDFFGNPASRNYWFDGTYIERVMYPGIVALFFGLFAVFKVKSREKKFFTALGILSLIIAANLPLVKYFYLLPIPVISTTIPTRELSIFIFSIIVLGAIGINHWLENKVKTKYPLFFALLIAVVFCVVFVIYKLGNINGIDFKVSIRNMLLPTFLAVLTIIAFYLKGILKKAGIILIFLIVIVDLFYFFNKITPFSPSSFTYPKTAVIEYLRENAEINRFWGYGSGYIAPNFQSVDFTYSPEGNDPLHISSYGELLASSKYGELPESLPRPDANIAPGFGNMELKSNPNRQRILNLLGIKYVLHRDELLSGEFNPDYITYPQDTYELIWQKNPWQIYENKLAFERFYLAGDYEVVLGRDEQIAKIYDEKIDLGKTLILEEDLDIKLGKISKSNIELVSYKPNKISFNVETDANSLFFVSDNYFVGWKALVDGKEVKIYKANYSFRAVVIPEGKHVVDFSYEPNSFRLGLIISLFSLSIILIIAIYAIISSKALKK